jgi:hypothetical protein
MVVVSGTVIVSGGTVTVSVITVVAVSGGSVTVVGGTVSWQITTGVWPPPGQRAQQRFALARIAA